MDRVQFQKFIKEQEKALPKRVFITPNVNKTEENFGLERYNMVLFPGCKRIEQLGYTTRFGDIRYLTGLDELVIDGREDLTDAEKDAKKLEIRKEVAYLEYKLANNILDPEDVDFWSKVKLLHPTNDEYWSKFDITLENERIALDMNNPIDRLKYHCILGGGFASVAPNYEIAVTDYKKYKWYLENPSEEVDTRIKVRMNKNKAISNLSEIYEQGDKNKLFAIVKAMSKNSSSYKRNEISLDKLYEVVDGWFSGNYYTCLYDNVNVIYDKFNELAKITNRHYLNTYAFVMDLINMKHLQYNDADGRYYSGDINQYLGRTAEEITNYLTSEIGKEALRKLVEAYGSMYDYIYVDDSKQSGKEAVEAETESASQVKHKLKIK
jgi:hypothetical protein